MSIEEKGEVKPLRLAPSVLKEIFELYDYDLSGTVNSVQEMLQVKLCPLLVALCLKENLYNSNPTHCS